MPADALTDTRPDDRSDDQLERGTKTTMTITLEADGFVGLRQAQAAGENAARQLRGVLPYDVRITGATTRFNDGDSDYDDIASASQLPAPEQQAPLQAQAAPTELPPPAPVFPLGVEAQRGGLPDGNLAINTPQEPTPGIGAVVTSSPMDSAPNPIDPGAGGPGRSDEGASAPANTSYEEMTNEELRTELAERQIEGRSNLKTKAEMVEALEADDAKE